MRKKLLVSTSLALTLTVLILAYLLYDWGLLSRDKQFVPSADLLAQIGATDGNRPVLIDFYAVWCGPCKRQAPLITEAEKEFAGKLQLLKVDIDADPAKLAQALKVTSIPTLVIVDPGRKAGYLHRGYLNRDQLRKFIEQSLAGQTPVK